jgi:hypothetical protein
LSNKKYSPKCGRLDDPKIQANENSKNNFAEKRASPYRRKRKQQSDFKLMRNVGYIN